MTAQRKPRLGEPYPGRPNSLLVHIPTWADMVDFGQGKAQMENGYPRSVVHPDIRLYPLKLSSAVRALIPDVHCTQYSVMLLSGSQAAISCKQYILSLSHLRDQSNFTNSIQIYSVEFMTSLCRDHHSSGPVLYAVIYPSELSQDFSDFWQRAGPGASSRLAQQCLKYGLSPRIRAWAPGPENAMQRSSEDLHPVYQQIRSRISGYFQRSTDNPQITRQVSPSDVFLYGSGMAAIYHVHQSLLKWRSGESISTGLLYEPTYRILQSYGPGLRAYKLGTDGDLDDLAAYLEAGPEDCPTVQAIWCECPSNPLLRTVDLQRLRQLANQHEILVVVDDSIASFANVNLLDVADIIVSSLSKYFSGYADVMAGSVVLNPNSKQYGAMRRQVASTYENGLFVEDAIQLELNGRDFLARIARINNTTQYLVTKLLPLLSNPSSPLTRIYHPSLCHSRAYYDRQMCSKSEEFEPGYGGVFTMEFIDIASSAIFFDHLDVYKGLSFGADVCIASPYMQMTGQAGKKQGATNDTNETIIRFSVGLEEAADILQIISTALDAADSVHMPKCQASL